MHGSTDLWTHRHVETNGIRLHCAVAGSGPLVLLLHGFPECWYSWRHQIPALAWRYLTVAPDLRGYNDSDKPVGLDAYRLEVLLDDVRDLIAAFGARRATLVGHDWGGVIAWAFAMYRPDLLERLVVLNCPHPTAYARYLAAHPRQLLRSWYMLVFQLPRVPEWLFRVGGYRGIENALRRGTVRPATFSADDLAVFKRAAAEPGALTAALNYYRAALRRPDPRGLLPDLRRLLGRAPAVPPRRITTPTLVVWGEDDFVLDKGLTLGMEDLFAAPLEIAYIPRCGHWVQQEAPAEVNDRLLAFLTRSDGRG
jgi:pimeloyl-ACP methyl ester carboxylesterase